MALPKAKVKERLKAKFPGVNLSQKRIDAIADKLKLPEDADDDAIDERLDELNDVFSFSDLARNDDRLRTEEAERKRKEQQDNPTQKPSDENPKTDPKTDSNPADIAKIVAAAIAPLMQEVASLKAGKIGDTRKAQLEAKLNGLEGVNPKFKATVLKNYGRMSFEDDDAFETFLSEVEEDAKEYVQEEANTGLGGIARPASSAPSSANTKSIDAEIEAWAGLGKKE